MPLAHGHLSIDAKVLDAVQWAHCERTYYCGEDSKMVNDIVQFYGPHPETVVAMHEGLIVYRARSTRGPKADALPPVCTDQ